MIHATTFLLSLTGFVLLLLAMSRHQRDWLRRTLRPAMVRALRLSAALLLALALAVAGASLGWAYGALAWFGWLTIAAALIVTANTNRERILKKKRP